MMKIVVDTNILISSIFWSGIPYKIVQKALDGNIEIYTSKFILDEVQKVLADPKEGFTLSEQEIDDILSCILLYANVVEPKVFIDIVKRDSKDNPIVACSVEVKADFLVTRDKDLLVLKQYAGVKIVTPEEFISS